METDIWTDFRLQIESFAKPNPTESSTVPFRSATILSDIVLSSSPILSAEI